MENGEDFFEMLKRFCEDRSIRQAIMPGFIAGFEYAKLVGTVKQVDDRSAPIWDHCYVENVEVLGAGTICYDDQGNFSPHVHVSVGEKERGGVATTSHLIEARVIFLAEMVVHEVSGISMLRRRDPKLYDVPLLGF